MTAFVMIAIAVPALVLMAVWFVGRSRPSTDHTQAEQHTLDDTWMLASWWVL